MDKYRDYTNVTRGNIKEKYITGILAYINKWDIKTGVLTIKEGTSTVNL